MKRRSRWVAAVLDYELQLGTRGGCPGLLRNSTGDAVDAIHLQFFGWVAVRLRSKPIGWIGEVERAVRLVDQVIGVVQALALVGVRENRDLRPGIDILESPNISLRVAHYG